MSDTAGTAALVEPGQLLPAVELARRTLAELGRILLGQRELHRLVLAGLLSRGHILLEGVPGVGKTALIKTLGELLQLDCKRVQFTPDLMPSDILGAHILQEVAAGRRELEFQAGPVFTNFLLADEINRASPKTQSALLEAMQERCVTLMGVTRPLPDPFFVLASQNPIELEGTYPLPEAQLDRFLFKLEVEPASVDVLDGIIATRRHGTPPPAAWRMSRAELDLLFATTARIYLPRPVARYIARLVGATHPNGLEASEAVRSYVTYGASPRAAIGLAESARALALIAGRPTAGFEDVKAAAGAVLKHRILLSYKARFDAVTPANIVSGLLDTLDEAGLDLPADVALRPAGAEAQS